MELCSSPQDAVRALLALCVIRHFEPQLVLQLVRQTLKIPRSSLLEADDNSLHQVALSLFHEAKAATALEVVQEAGLWEDLYQPDDVIGEPLRGLSGTTNFGSAINGTAVKTSMAIAQLRELVSSHGWDAHSDVTIAGGFYKVFFQFETKRSAAPYRHICVDVDNEAQSWLTEPIATWRRLKHRHLSLWGHQVLWVNNSAAATWDNSEQGLMLEQWLQSMGVEVLDLSDSGK